MFFGGTTKSRVSPIGSIEYTPNEAGYLWANPTRDADAVTFFGNDSGFPQYTVYKPGADTPPVRSHERIHVGQARLERPPSMRLIESVMGSEPMGYEGTWGPWDLDGPAYAFGQRATRMPGSELLSKEYNNYINLLRRTNAGERGINSIEASVPEWLERQYLKQGGLKGPTMPMPGQLGTK